MVGVENNSRNTTNKWDTDQQSRLFMLRNGDLLSVINDASAMVQDC